MTDGPTIGLRQVAEDIGMPTAFESPPERPVVAYVTNQFEGLHVLGTEG